MTDDRLQYLAQAMANALAREYNQRYGSNIPVPVPLTFELELRDPKTAGMAHTQYGINAKGANIIKAQFVELNMTLFRDNAREFLNSTIPHEIAHLDQRWRDIRSGSQSQAHGYVWQASMRAMHQAPAVKHNMDTTKAVAVYKKHKAELKAKAKKAKEATKEAA